LKHHIRVKPCPIVRGLLSGLNLLLQTDVYRNSAFEKDRAKKEEDVAQCT